LQRKVHSKHCHSRNKRAIIAGPLAGSAPVTVAALLLWPNWSAIL